MQSELIIEQSVEDHVEANQEQEGLIRHYPEFPLQIYSFVDVYCY